jgi:anaerobic ribonucleoside-triphosphate reductase activating protein
MQSTTDIIASRTTGGANDALSPRERGCGEENRLVIGGFVPFSATDYPEHLCAVVFCQRCPWRCGYCHNAHLQRAQPVEEISWKDVLAFLERRRGLLDAVVFSGGEPTGQPGLRAAVFAVKQRGFKVGLHTAGIYPRRLAEVLPLLDWVGFDIKAPFERYEHVTGVQRSEHAARKSAELVIASGVAHEFRTTFDRTLLTDKDVAQLRAELALLGARRHVVQSCQPIVA